MSVSKSSHSDPLKSDTPHFVVENIVKHFPIRASGSVRGGVVRAVDGVSFSIQKNEILGCWMGNELLNFVLIKVVKI